MTVHTCYLTRLRFVRPTPAIVVLMVILVTVTLLVVSRWQNWEYKTVQSDSKSKEFKYILLWHSHDYMPFIIFEHGRQAFIKNKCPVNHCYVAHNKNFQKDVTEFDAIAFNGRTMNYLRKVDLPQKRSPKQKYLYFNMESNMNYPVVPKWFNNFFNWTLTYRLDSDIPFLYMQVTNKKGEVLGPKPNMKWIEKMDDVPEDLVTLLRNKTKPVAWFVSNCRTRSKREDHFRKLNSALSSYGLEIDVYGKCGKKSCTFDQDKECNKMLERDYLFYLAYENSCSKDYVTEKVLRSFEHYTVPIVYGGAHYSRFLPPNSYIDTSVTTPIEIAGIIARSMHSLTLYKQFFRWRSHYDYSDLGAAKVCALCAALHNKTLMETKTTYKNMRSWWNEK